MRKRISIDQLKIGMKIEKLDCSWLATPFLRIGSRFLLLNKSQQLQASGVQQLEIEADDGEQDSGSTDQLWKRRLKPLSLISPPVESTPPTVPFTEELPVAKQATRQPN